VAPGVTTEAQGRTQAEKLRQNAVVVVGLLLAAIFAITITVTISNNNKLIEILEDSIKAELIATANAAQDDIDMDLFLAVQSAADIEANQAAFDETVNQLRSLRDEVGATYIYALKEVGGKYYFVFDTDEELGVPGYGYDYFSEYELSQVHKDAFAGIPGADVSNVSDEWGSFNTGAVPLYHDDKLVGIVCVDFEDSYVQLSHQTATVGGLLLASVLAVSLGLLIAFLVFQTRRNRKTNEELFRLVNNDYVTGLLNRYYFYSYFKARNEHPHLKDDPYGLLFVDLDNFKKVNDAAGHDVGDELLRLIAGFLRSYTSTYTGKSSVQSMTCRIGGDEFLVTLPGVSTNEEITERARTMLADFAKIPELQRFIQGYSIGLSVGGALYPTQTAIYDETVKLADIAMYDAKEHGKNNFSLYDESMYEGADDLNLSVR
jgi:diguanylate cyclase (GGDEF)-like protein